jgi:hypothetical protein
LKIEFELKFTIVPVVPMAETKCVTFPPVLFQISGPVVL